MDARKKKEHAWATQEGFASESWWVGLGRDEFYRRVSGEQARLTRSRFGRTELMSLARNVSESKRKDSIFGDEE